MYTVLTKKESMVSASSAPETEKRTTCRVLKGYLTLPLLVPRSIKPELAEGRQ